MAATVGRENFIGMSPPSVMPDEISTSECRVSICKPKIESLSPALFAGLTVHIAIDDRAMHNAVASAMMDVGASICTSSVYLADVVIAESRAYSIPQIRSGRGSKLVGGNAKSPQIVLLAQIPWVFDKRRMVVSKPAVVARRQVPMVVVADDCGRFRPVFKAVNENVRLYFPRSKIRGMTCCPFSPVPEHYVRARQQMVARNEERMVVVPTGPADKGYCELCQVSYDTAEEHHASFDHRRNSGAMRWRDFDDMAVILNKRTVW